MNGSATKDDERSCVREMAVGHVREPEDADYAEVVFLDSARFYRLREDNPVFEEALRLLKSAAKTSSVLRVSTSSVDSDVIEDVSTP